MHPLPRRFALAVPLLLALASAAHAGQVRIDALASTFSPTSVTLNLGDQVVWVEITGNHTVTHSGSPDPSACLIATSPLFNANLFTGGRFSWKSTVTGSIPFFCQPHCTVGMGGMLIVVANGASVAEFRISEVRYTVGHTDDFVEIANLGTVVGDLGQYRLSVVAGSAVTFTLPSITVLPLGRVVVHLGRTGTNTQTDLYFSTLNLPGAGSAALYVPNTVAPALTDTRMMVDYVEWGAAGQANEATAMATTTPNLWPSAQFVPRTAEGHSIEFCGLPSQHGAMYWKEISTPTPGTYGACVTPALTSTWGRLKSIYR